MVKVFMLCNPTVYLLVIWVSEEKHILCLISHLLSGWIHSFSRMPYGDNSGVVGGLRGCFCACVHQGYQGELSLVGYWMFIIELKLNVTVLL